MMVMVASVSKKSVVVSSHKVIAASIKSDFIDHHYEN